MQSTKVSIDIWEGVFYEELRRRCDWLSLTNQAYEGEIRTTGDIVLIPSIAIREGSRYGYTGFDIHVSRRELMASNGVRIAIPLLTEGSIAEAAGKVASIVNDFWTLLFTCIPVSPDRLITVGLPNAEFKNSSIEHNRKAIRALLFALPDLARRMFLAKVNREPYGYTLIVTPEVHTAFEQYSMFTSGLDLLRPVYGFNIVRSSSSPVNDHKHRLIATNLFEGSFVSKLVYPGSQDHTDGVNAQYVYGGEADESHRWGIDFYFEGN